MGSELFSYTGTGNSLWAARALAAQLGEARVRPMKRCMGVQIAADTLSVGLVFPVYIYGLPRPVVEFVRALSAGKGTHLFAVATNGGQPGRSLAMLARLLDARGMRLCGGYSLEMPSNYVPWSGPGSPEEQEELFRHAEEKLSRIASEVRGRSCALLETAGGPAAVVRSSIYHLTYPLVHRMDRLFRVDGVCSRCGTCVKVCPAGNVRLGEEGPEWHRGCEQCFACLQWCPRQNIQWGKSRPNARYHHPLVTRADIIAGAPLREDALQADPAPGR
jgi:ferredoxin